MVMMTQNSVEALLNSGPDRASKDYANAWSTVRARVARVSDAQKKAIWTTLLARLEGLGEPERRKPATQAEALLRATEANQARVVGRSRAAILRRIDEAQFKRVVVTDGKPWLFEAALQMIEDGAVSLHSFTHDFAERGPAAVEGRRKIRRLVLAPPDPERGRPCPWMSRKKQAEQEARI